MVAAKQRGFIVQTHRQLVAQQNFLLTQQHDQSNHVSLQSYHQKTFSYLWVYKTISTFIFRYLIMQT
jgi:hypothetical protein